MTEVGIKCSLESATLSCCQLSKFILLIFETQIQITHQYQYILSRFKTIQASLKEFKPIKFAMSS